MNDELHKSVIIVDSCCELEKDFITDIPIFKVPFKILIGDNEYTDDENLNLQDMLADMKNVKTAARSACPSPQAFMEIIEKLDEKTNIFMVTLSSKLSGAYNSAIVAKNNCLENNKNRFIHVFDSLSASAGEMNVVIKIVECLRKNISNNDIVEKVTNYIENATVNFILQDYNNFIKNGRMSNVEAFLVNMFGIVPIMAGKDGEIIVQDKTRGMNKALARVVALMKEKVTHFEETTLSITHCDAIDLANQVKDLVIENNCNFKEILIRPTDGLSTMYANLGGIIISY